MKSQILSIFAMAILGAVAFFITKDWDRTAPLTNGNAVFLIMWAVTWIVMTRK